MKNFANIPASKAIEYPKSSVFWHRAQNDNPTTPRGFATNVDSGSIKFDSCTKLKTCIQLILSYDRKKFKIIKIEDQIRSPLYIWIIFIFWVGKSENVSIGHSNYTGSVITSCVIRVGFNISVICNGYLKLTFKFNFYSMNFWH